MSRLGDVEWPARSPDLSPLDFFLWGHLKERVYRDSPKTLTELKEAFAKEIKCNGSGEKAVFDSMKKRVQDCIQSRGCNFKNFLFKK